MHLFETTQRIEDRFVFADRTHQTSTLLSWMQTDAHQRQVIALSRTTGDYQFIRGGADQLSRLWSAASTWAATIRPASCVMLPAFAKCSVNIGSIASSASGASGVVA